MLHFYPGEVLQELVARRRCKGTFSSDILTINRKYATRRGLNHGPPIPAPPRLPATRRPLFTVQPVGDMGKKSNFTSSLFPSPSQLADLFPSSLNLIAIDAIYSSEPIKANHPGDQPVPVVDLTDFGESFAVRCVGAMLENHVFKVEFSNQQPPFGHLLHLYIAGRNAEKCDGSHPLKIGYPYLQTTMGRTAVFAPLLLWEVQLEAQPHQTEQWSLHRLPYHRLTPNTTLLQQLDAHYQTTFSSQAGQLCRHHQIQGKELTDFCRLLARKLELTRSGTESSAIRLPETAATLQPGENGRLHWGATLGLFRSPVLPPESIPTTPKRALPRPPYWEINFSPLPLDPQQREALVKAGHHRQTAVEGKAGSGKTYLAAACAAAALTNGQTCLVVSRQLPTLKAVQRLLGEHGLSNLTFLAATGAAGFPLLPGLLRGFLDRKSDPPKEPERFQAVLQRTLRLQEQMDQALEALHKPILGEADGRALTGQFLNAAQKEAQETLGSRLNATDFDFHETEYRQILAAIEHSEPLFLRFPNLNHPLTQLDKQIFLTHAEEDARWWVETTLGKWIRETRELHQQFNGQLTVYNEALFNYYESGFRSLDQQVEDILHTLEDTRLEYGPAFDKTGSEKIIGVFSGKYRSMAETKNLILQACESLFKNVQENQFFEFDLPTPAAFKQVTKLEETILGFRDALHQWKSRIPALVRDAARRLKSNSIPPEIDFQDRVASLEAALEAFILRFNESGLYADTTRHELLTIPKKRDFLAALFEQLEQTRFFLRDFSDVYTWQRHWLGLELPAQKVVAALGALQPQHWKLAFQSWYLYQLLQKTGSAPNSWKEGSQNSLLLHAKALRALLPDFTAARWSSRKSAALKTLQAKDRAGGRKWLGKQTLPPETPQETDAFLADNLPLIAEVVPALLVTPEAAIRLISNANWLPDLLLVDDAHRLEASTLKWLSELPGRLVILGNSALSDPKAETAQGAETAPPTTHLRCQHNPWPASRTAFNHTAFQLPELPAQQTVRWREATQVAPVMGRYDEKSATNETEARQILDWLMDLSPATPNAFPTVGIACATEQQRDLIAGQLLRIRQQKLPGYEKIQQLHLHGLGIYQFSEMPGLQADILLVSFTHGIAGPADALSSHLHFWNTQAGFAQLELLCTTAAPTRCITHSLPTGILNVLAANTQLLGTHILAHLLLYDQQVAGARTDNAEAYLRQMKQTLNRAESQTPPTDFIREVRTALEAYFDPSQMQAPGHYNGLPLPLRIHEKQKNEHWILLPHGFFSTDSLSTCEWEKYCADLLTAGGFRILSLTPENWWKSPGQEARRIAKMLLSGT